MAATSASGTTAVRLGFFQLKSKFLSEFKHKNIFINLFYTKNKNVTQSPLISFFHNTLQRKLTPVVSSEPSVARRPLIAI